ncbi:MAG: hypothetical protein A2008_04720 [Candidatus Wallbacteria bacterium GWC2_49_35]|uniref:SMP-30/Gluconolactonase/LRE-like region domain-containing protein n=1 Tax=Candidatus Wallbacteria bacterium GWC2_49_35 TaxID=1817813 RepID=A0A1F7WPM0_9BACT|nr:MAG: hypothetical protein A2008_04720 [Candidatus Wallbacteria bacterium GWC2_49_35]HBC76465.1 hypothetical protein [Candidatus Wallbacteria bacterium]
MKNTIENGKTTITGKPFAAALLALIPVLAILLGCALLAAPAMAQDKAPAAPATAEVALPDIKEGKTVEVCVLGLGSGSDSVGLGSETTPAFASNGPSSLAIDKDENVYLLDAINFRVIKIARDGKIAALINYPQGETDKKDDCYYMCDLAISPENGNIYLLNQTLKNVFILSQAGEVRGTIDVKEHCVLPYKIFVSNFGEILVSDQADGKVMVYNAEGTVTGRLNDDTAGVYSDKKGFIFALGEMDKDGRDVLLMDGASKRQPRVYAKLAKSIKDTEPYDYQILGLDANYNFYASIVEKIAEDVIQTLVYKFDEAGKAVARVKIMPLIHIGDTMPTRYFNISPNGTIYGVTSNNDFTKYVIVRIE